MRPCLRLRSHPRVRPRRGSVRCAGARASARTRAFDPVHTLIISIAAGRRRLTAGPAAAGPLPARAAVAGARCSSAMPACAAPSCISLPQPSAALSCPDPLPCRLSRRCERADCRECRHRAQLLLGHYQHAQLWQVRAAPLPCLPVLRRAALPCPSPELPCLALCTLCRAASAGDAWCGECRHRAQLLLGHYQHAQLWQVHATPLPCLPVLRRVALPCPSLERPVVSPM